MCFKYHCEVVSTDLHLICSSSVLTYINECQKCQVSSISEMVGVKNFFVFHLIWNVCGSCKLGGFKIKPLKVIQNICFCQHKNENKIISRHSDGEMWSPPPPLTLGNSKKPFALVLGLCYPYCQLKIYTNFFNNMFPYFLYFGVCALLF